VLVATAAFLACAQQPRQASPPQRQFQPPPAPAHPKIEGRVSSVSSGAIREVISLKQQDMLKEYGRVLPIYTIRVIDKNHIQVQYWGADGVEYWRDARRVKGKWKFDELVPVILAVTDIA
jgi:hypothetical protein